MNVRKEVVEHLQKHIVYPANKAQIIEACNKMMDVSQEDKKWFEKNLPEWSYRNAGEVIRAIQIVDHLGHVDYPTNKKELIRACNKMTDFPKDHRDWFERNLPERPYRNPDEVIGAITGIIHVREHVTYPAAKSAIVETCYKMTEVPEAYRELFVKYLPERVYNNPDDVIRAFRI